MAIKYDAHGNPTYILNGVQITKTPEGLLVGTGLDQVLIRGSNLKVSDAASWIAGHYPDNYPFSAPHRHPEEDTYRNFALDANFPPDGIPLDRLPRVIRELKKMVAGSSSVQTTFPSTVKDGDLVVWDASARTYKPATCPAGRANIAAGIFFNGVADLSTNSVLLSSTVTHKAWNLQTGQKYFLDCSNPGKLTTTDTGYFVGIAQGPQTLFLAPLADSAESLITALEQAQSSLQAAHNQLRKDFDAYKNGGVRKPNGGIGIDPTTKGLYIVCDEIEGCINEKVKKLFSTPPSEGGSSSSTAPSDIIQNIIQNISSGLVKPGQGLEVTSDGRLKVKCSDLSTCINETIWGAGSGSGGSGSSLNPSANSNVCKAVKACLQHLIDPTKSGLYFDTDGKLCVSLQELDPDELAAILQSMIIPNGGLVIESTTVNGETKYGLKVNFGSMGPDAFNELKASLKLPIILTKTLNIYVNKNSSNADDVIEETVTDSFGQTTKRFLVNKGQDIADPFATISAAVRYVTENFNLSTFYCNIYIHSDSLGTMGVYNENVVLPAYQSSGGAIYLYSWDGFTEATADDESYFTIKAPTAVQNSLQRNAAVAVTGGNYAIFGAKLTSSPETVGSRIGYCPVVYIGSASLSLNGCWLQQSYMNTSISGSLMNGYLIYISDSGILSLNAWKTTTKFSMTAAADASNKLFGIYCGGKGSIGRYYASDEYEGTFQLTSSASCNTFLLVGTGGKFQGAGIGNEANPYPTFTGSIAGGNGYPYDIRGGASITCAAGTDYFPRKSGVAGLVDSTHFGFFATS